MSYLPRAKEVIDIEIAGLRRARETMADGFDAAAAVILEALAAGGKIVVCGVGKNLHIAEKISATLASTGSTSVVLNPTQAIHGDLGIVADGDVLLALSYSGESDEILAVVPVVRRLGMRIVALTGTAESSLAQHSDAAVVAAVDREACPFNMAPTASSTAALAVGDALAMVLLEARGFKKDDYARLHPGGAIGRAMLLKVSEIMRRDDKLAAVPADGNVKDAVLAMTRTRSGAVGVVDGDGRLVGIFTDGDLRRHLPDTPDLLARPVGEVMTASPVTVRPEQLAVDVLRVYETHRIDDVLVVDDSGRLVGSIDIQDLPKFKIL